jgi:hypothetical protein
MLINIVSEPGSGKTYSLKNLNPKETFILSADKKGLSWAGWRKDYNKANKNYVETDDVEVVKTYIKGLVEKRPDIKVIVIDTLSVLLQKMLNTDKSRNALDRWKSYGEEAYNLYEWCTGLRRKTDEEDDLFIVFLCHSESYKTVDIRGNDVLALRTSFAGAVSHKNLLSKFLNYNVYSFFDAEEEEVDKRYKFVTQSNGRTEARSVEGVLPLTMPNDLKMVINLIREKDLCLTTTATEETIA